MHDGLHRQWCMIDGFHAFNPLTTMYIAPVLNMQQRRLLRLCSTLRERHMTSRILATGAKKLCHGDTFRPLSMLLFLSKESELQATCSHHMHTKDLMLVTYSNYYVKGCTMLLRQYAVSIPASLLVLIVTLS